MLCTQLHDSLTVWAWIEDKTGKLFSWKTIFFHTPWHVTFPWQHMSKWMYTIIAALQWCSPFHDSTCPNGCTPSLHHYSDVHLSVTAHIQMDVHHHCSTTEMFTFPWQHMSKWMYTIIAALQWCPPFCDSTCPNGCTPSWQHYSDVHLSVTAHIQMDVHHHCSTTEMFTFPWQHMSKWMYTIIAALQWCHLSVMIFQRHSVSNNHCLFNSSFRTTTEKMLK